MSYESIFLPNEVSYLQLGYWGLLVCILLYLLYPHILWYDPQLFSTRTPLEEKPMINSPIFQIYTPKTLAQASCPSRLLIAVLGRVYDVTSGYGFYGPEGPYHIFSGRDASRGLAKHSFDSKWLTPIDQPIDPLKDLTKMEREEVEQWAMHFASKYVHVGNLVDEAEVLRG